MRFRIIERYSSEEITACYWSPNEYLIKIERQTNFCEARMYYDVYELEVVDVISRRQCDTHCVPV